MTRMTGLLLVAAWGLSGTATAAEPLPAWPTARAVPMPAAPLPAQTQPQSGELTPMPAPPAGGYRAWPMRVDVAGPAQTGQAGAAVAPSCQSCECSHLPPRRAIDRLRCVHRKIHGDIPKGHCEAVHESVADATWNFVDMFIAFREWHRDCYCWCEDVRADCCGHRRSGRCEGCLDCGR